MDEINDFLEKLQAIVEQNTRYKLEAYSFLLAALNHTLRKLPKARHVTGRELLEGIREFAVDQYGPLTRLVFEHWGVHATKDFGHLVFTLVDAGLMRKTEQDSLADFENVYDFKEVFDRGYRIEVDELDMGFYKPQDEESGS
mgnify:CR=1 FL=1|jgi:uncharacterized repeat protein (TIGR04138 family)